MLYIPYNEIASSKTCSDTETLFDKNPIDLIGSYPQASQSYGVF